MSLNDALRISSSGLTAERFRLDVISSNIANANTVGLNGSDPYQRRVVELIGTNNGVEVAGIVKDQTPFGEKVDFSDPNHDPKTGLVKTSNVQPVVEMVDMMGASRAYEANVEAFKSAKGMIQEALTIGKV